MSLFSNKLDKPTVLRIKGYSFFSTQMIIAHHKYMLKKRRAQLSLTFIL